MGTEQMGTEGISTDFQHFFNLDFAWNMRGKERGQRAGTALKNNIEKSVMSLRFKLWCVIARKMRGKCVRPHLLRPHVCSVE